MVLDSEHLVLDVSHESQQTFICAARVELPDARNLHSYDSRESACCIVFQVVARFEIASHRGILMPQAFSCRKARFRCSCSWSTRSSLSASQHSIKHPTPSSTSSLKQSHQCFTEDSKAAIVLRAGHTLHEVNAFVAIRISGAQRTRR